MLDSLREAVMRADERYVRWMTGTPAPEVRSSSADWGTWQGEASSTAVTQSSALKLLAVTGSVQLLTESISTLPIDVFTKTPTARMEQPLPRWLKEPIIGLTFTDW